MYKKSVVLLILISLFYSCDKDDASYIDNTSIYDEAYKTWIRYSNWKGNDDVIVFPLITDLHSGENYKYKHISYLIRTDSLFQYNFIANLGDLGIDEDKSIHLLHNIYLEHEKYENLTIFCKGNHEDIISDLEFSHFLQKPFLNKSKYKINIHPNSAFGYFDIEDCKTRIFFLNTSDNSTSYSFSEIQLKYIIENLMTVPEDDWFVVFLAHWCPHPIGYWNHSTSQKVNHKTFMKILKSYVLKIQDESDFSENISLSWDFRNVRGHLVGYLCGDSHFDNQIKDSGVNYIITQGYGTISEFEKPHEAVTTAFDDNRQMLVDIVAIKPSKREMRLFRLGAGGEKRDRTFSF